MTYESRLSITVDSQTGERNLKSLRGELNRTEAAGDRAGDSMRGLEVSLSGIKTMALAAAGALSVIGVTELTSGVLETVRSTESLKASLKTVTGSVSDANAAWDRLLEFAKTTPFSLDQSVTGFIRMKSLGLDPTTEALTSFGNTASAMGKDLMQMIEAVADASTGEFERLKEFGISAEKQGEDVTFTFQGVETTIRSSAQEITRYLESIGSIEFAGAMIDQMDTLDGKISNLDDGVDALFRAIGDAGATDAFNLSIDSAAKVVEALTENVDTLADAVAIAAGVFGARLVGGVAAAGSAMVVAQLQAVRYQATLASMAGVSATAATAQLSLAAASRGATAAMALMGGPVGALALAAGGLYYFREELFLTAPEITAAKDQVEAFNESLGDLSESAVRLEISSLTRQIAEIKEVADAATARVTAAAAITNNGNGILGVSASSITEYSRELQESSPIAVEYRIQIETLEAKLEAANKHLLTLTSSTENDTGSRISNANAIRDQIAANRAWYSEHERAYDRLQGVVDRIDPLGAELRALTEDITKVQEAFSHGWITSEQADEIVNRLNRIAMSGKDIGKRGGFKDSGAKAGADFSDAFEAQTARVADSLQNAITSGNWAGIGATVGAGLASGIAQHVSNAVGGSLGQGIAAAIGGPLLGAVAGGVVGLAAEQIADYFRDDWDPTAMRQAAQGTGTLLGSIDEKSKSISEAVGISADATSQLVGINRSMLAALQNVQAGISGATTMIARGASGVSIGAPSVMSGGDMFSGVTGGVLPIFDQTLGATFDFFDTMGEILTFGLLDLGGMLGGKAKKKDEGIRIVGGYIGDLIDDTLVQAYSTFRVKKHAFDDYDTKESYRALGDDVSTQFSLVFESLLDSVVAGGDALGLNANTLKRRLEKYSVETQRISLEGLSAAEQQAEIEAVFSTVFDDLADAAVPFIDEFQQAGEGLGETLARVATQTQTVQYAVDALGIRFSDLSGRQLVTASERLITLAGGLDTFITGMQGFIGNFATDAQQFELTYNSLTSALAQASLQLPLNREGYYALMQAQNGATEAGAQNIATLLRLQGTADSYYSLLEDAQRSVFESQIDLLEVQQSAISDTLREAERASGSIARAMSGLSVTGSQFTQASRESALASLQSMASTGRIGSQDDLDSALRAATSIQAGEFSTMNDYIRGVARTGETLKDLKWVTDQQVTKEQRLLSNIEARIEAMSEKIASINGATAKHTAKTAKLLERIDQNGVEVRA